MATMRCHYEVMEIDQLASQDDVCAFLVRFSSHTVRSKSSIKNLH